MHAAVTERIPISWSPVPDIGAIVFIWQTLPSSDRSQKSRRAIAARRFSDLISFGVLCVMQTRSVALLLVPIPFRYRDFLNHYFFSRPPQFHLRSALFGIVVSGMFRT